MAPRLALALTAALIATPAAQAQRPPAIALVTKSGTQRAVQQSYCVSQQTEAGGVTGCADFVYVAPRRYSPVRTAGTIRIRVRGATLVRGRVDIYVRDTGRRIGAFRLAAAETRWKVSLRRPRDYILAVSIRRFETADGRSGDTSGNLGLRVRR